MNLKQLHEQFIAQAERPMSFGRVPVVAKEAEMPVIAVERWREFDGALHKTFRFRRIEDRDRFVMELLAYERVEEHNADITISHDQVSLRLQTKDIERPTSLDKEYARYSDTLYKDICYAP